MKIYHSFYKVVEYSYIRINKYTKDFSWGFYCTNNYKQACRWAFRHEGRVVNIYDYKENVNLNIKKFVSVNDEI